jgi:hypothetical protein
MALDAPSLAGDTQIVVEPAVQGEVFPSGVYANTQLTIHDGQFTEDVMVSTTPTSNILQLAAPMQYAHSVPLAPDVVRVSLLHADQDAGRPRPGDGLHRPSGDPPGGFPGRRCRRSRYRLHAAQAVHDYVSTLMGRADVRATVADYLTGLAVPFVGTVYPARTYINEGDYDSFMNTAAVSTVEPGVNLGCVLVVNIPSERRNRKAPTFRGQVQDTEIHDIALEVFFASTSGRGVVTQDGYDAVIDAIFDGLRADPLLGNGDVIWSAGEFAPGIHHVQVEPYTDEDGLTVFINGVIRFEAWEWLTGAGV